MESKSIDTIQIARNTAGLIRLLSPYLSSSRMDYFRAPNKEALHSFAS